MSSSQREWRCAEPGRFLRWLPVLSLALLGLAAAPVLGLLRDRLLATFPRSFILVLGGALGAAFLGLLAFGVRQIRDRQALRYGALLAVVGLVALQTFVFNRGIPQVDVVEKVHFVQFGLLAFLIYRARRPEGDASLLWMPVLGVLLVGTLEEWVQWLVPSRTGEIKDVLLNTYAGVCGLLLSLSLRPPPRLDLRRGLRMLPFVLGAALIWVGAFFHLAHLGYLIEDPAIGSFRSWSTAEDLLAASATRAARWSRKTPRLKHWFGVEDRFATEAGWHVSHRNTSSSQGLALSAWRENQILQKYYEPFLDLTRASGTQGPHRLGKEQVEALRSALPAQAPRRPYVSPVLEGRVVTSISKAAFWSCIAAAVIALWLPSFLLQRRRGSA